MRLPEIFFMVPFRKNFFDIYIFVFTDLIVILRKIKTKEIWKFLLENLPIEKLPE